MFCNDYIIYAIKYCNIIYAFTIFILSYSSRIKPWLAWFIVRFFLRSNITCCSERVVQIRRQRIPSANAAKKTSGASPPKATQSTMLFLQISLSLQHLDLIWGQSSSEVRENWKLWKKQCNYYLVWSGKAPSINPSNNQARDWWRWPLSVQNLQLYWSWRRRCKRLACSYWYKDEKVLIGEVT